jgi:poly-beta-1,6-N-acetyl-D-glucosamine synthase
MPSSLTYVLITPTRNEAKLIERTLKSVVSQTLKPRKWIVVNDGSTDGTAEIVTKYAEAHSWIELMHMPERRERSFAGKALAVRKGQTSLGELQYDIIGNLDADVSFEPDYFTFLMDRFAENPRLGVGGTAFHEEGRADYDYEFVGTEHVSGMCQMFRRECFEAIGGYATLKSGGIDLIAVLSARAKGWETRTFREKTFIHHRGQGTALHSGLSERLHIGRKDYLVGNHPFWEIFRSAYQMTRKPYLIGGILIFAAYSWNAVRRVERSIPKDLMAFRRGEQLERLKLVILRRLTPRSVASTD